MSKKRPIVRRPILRGFTDGNSLLVWCPYCDRFHIHGWSEDEKPRTPSHRVAHCLSEDSPFNDTGYYVGIFRKSDQVSVVGRAAATTAYLRAAKIAETFGHEQEVGKRIAARLRRVAQAERRGGA